MEVEDFFLGRPALRFPILFCFPCFFLFLFFFFFLFTNAALFHSFYHLVRQCTVSVWYWPHSADRCLYTIVKPPKHVARTPLSANPPTIHALPRSPALGYFFHLLFFLLLFIISHRHRHLLRVHYLFSLLLLAVSPARLLAPHRRDLRWFRTSRLIHNSPRPTRYPHSISSHHAFVVGTSHPTKRC